MWARTLDACLPRRTGTTSTTSWRSSPRSRCTQDRRICYVGTDAVDIVAELDGLEPSWVTTARLLREGARITGVLISEWDGDLGRAWLIGPWVVGDGDGWMAAAAALLDAALASMPPAVSCYEMCGDIANQRLADLAGSRGWTPTEPNHVLVVDAGVVAAWQTGRDGHPAVLRAAVEADIGGIAELHDAEFPEHVCVRSPARRWPARRLPLGARR